MAVQKWIHRQSVIKPDTQVLSRVRKRWQCCRVNVRERDRERNARKLLARADTNGFGVIVIEKQFVAIHVYKCCRWTMESGEPAWCPVCRCRGVGNRCVEVVSDVTGSDGDRQTNEFTSCERSSCRHVHLNVLLTDLCADLTATLARMTSLPARTHSVTTRPRHAIRDL